MTRIGIAGCTGRMGRELVACVLAHEKAKLAAATARPGSSLAGEPVRDAQMGATGVAIAEDPAALFAADVVIDFTEPEATVRHAALAAETGKALVVGTTGLSAKQQAAVDAAAERAPILQAANFSLGVNLLLGLVSQAAAALPDTFDIEILEMHHRHKLDAPSGTALALGAAAATARGAELDAVASRHSRAGARRRGAIGFATLRGGDVAGEHSVIFAGDGERLELTHRAGARRIFAQGAVAAALWLAGKAPGRYAMTDVLGL